MFEWPFVFVAGLVGSSHCLGMCGPFAVAIGAAHSSMRTNFARQAAYSAGRMFTYAVLGAFAGYAGLALSGRVSQLQALPAILSILAGILLGYQGLKSAGVLAFGGVKEKSSGCLQASFFGTLFSGRTQGEVFLAGMATGFLPCGLLYGMLALAASSANLAVGSATMALFGLGTAPAMVAVGLAGGIMGVQARRRMFRAAAWCLVLAGVVSFARGAVYFTAGESDARATCPLCG